MTHIEHDPTTQNNLRAARTFQQIPPEHHLVEWRSLADLITQRAAEAGQRRFLTYFNDQTDETLRWSYADLLERAARIANLLVNEYGVQHGERVATLAYNHPDTVAMYVACWLIGATVAPQNVGEDDTRIAFILRNTAARVLLARPEYAERARTLAAEAANVVHVVALDAAFDAALAAQSTTFHPTTTPSLEDEALLVYTSGTTGAPKGVQLSHYNLLADCTGIERWHGIDGDTRLMCILPLHHVNGIVVTLITPLLARSSVVLNRGFSAGTFWRRVADERVNIVSVVPTILQYLCEAHGDTSDLDLSQLRYVICGAGTLAVALVRRFTEQFGVRVLHGYGLSETTCYSCFLPVDLPDAEYTHWMATLGYPSIGVPIWPNEMAIHDAAGQEVAAGEKGEIVIRGHNVMLGYFERPDANAEAFKYGWFRSGDEGFMQRDEQNRPFFFITGRLKELINRGGVKYSPFEIEEVMLGVAGVRTALAIAFPNSWYGEEIGAYIVLDAGASVTAEQVLAHCRAHMPAAKCPKVVVFGSDIPVTATGKYQRLRLQDLFAEWSETQFRG